MLVTYFRAWPMGPGFFFSHQIYPDFYPPGSKIGGKIEVGKNPEICKKVVGKNGGKISCLLRINFLSYG